MYGSYVLNYFTGNLFMTTPPHRETHNKSPYFYNIFNVIYSCEILFLEQTHSWTRWCPMSHPVSGQDSIQFYNQMNYRQYKYIPHIQINILYCRYNHSASTVDSSTFHFSSKLQFTMLDNGASRGRWIDMWWIQIFHLWTQSFHLWAQTPKEHH